MGSRFVLCMVIAVLASSPLSAQDKKTVEAVRFAVPPTIDGVLDDEAWEQCAPLGDFIQLYPEYGKASPVRTVVRIGYDDETIYVAFHCYDPDPSGISAAITQRDGALEEDDTVAVAFDTFDDGSNGYYFVTNLLSTQDEGRIADNGRSNTDSWDATWRCASERTGDGWCVEYAIPLRVLRFKSGENVTWGVNFLRVYPRRQEICSWNGPLEHHYRVSQYGDLTGLNVRTRSKRYDFIPYAIARFQEDEKSDAEAGLDVRYRLSSTLSADVTVNPDFATIEADEEEINLTRFEQDLEEKRPFFLEGSQHFNQRIRQFYSRRIGDIPWGTKLSGSLAGFDIALMGAQSDPAETAGDAAAQGENASYSVARAKKVVFGSSNIGFLAANRRWNGEDQGSVGVDASLFFTSTFGMTAQFVRAHGPEDDGALAWFVRPAWDGANSHFHMRYTNLDEGLLENMNTVGFLTDDDRKEFDTNYTRTFWLNRYGIESIEPDINYNRYWSQEGVLRSWDLDAEIEITLTSKWQFELSRNDEFKRYEEDFENHRTEFEVGYDTRRGRSAYISYGWGRNYGSDLRLIQGRASFKITDSWNSSYELTKLWLDPDPETESTWIHAVRSTYSFNPDFFVKVFFQTNSSIDKKNAQAILVWRFLPPFGALQFAYQHGTSSRGTASEQGHTLFTKLSWVF